MQDRAYFSDSAEGTPSADPEPGGGAWPEWIRGRILFDELQSTQDEARRLIADGYAELPFFVQALRQTAGRGRGEHRWSAGEGALAFTLVFDPATIGIGQDRVATLAIGQFDADGPVGAGVGDGGNRRGLGLLAAAAGERQGPEGEGAQRGSAEGVEESGEAGGHRRG